MGTVVSRCAPPVVLTIAGFDPSSGAGITADLKVFAAHRLYGVAAITALTVQSTQGVRRTVPIAPELLEQTLSCLADDGEIQGVKIGMLASAANVAVVARFLRSRSIPPARVVLDPVIRSSSGSELLDPEGLVQLRSELLGQVGWVTPNAQELGWLLAGPAEALSLNRSQLPQAAAELQVNRPNLNVVVTGGDRNPPEDFLRTPDGSERWFSGEWIQTIATHGTGCAFSSALLANIIRGTNAEAAVQEAKSYVTCAMQAAYPIGKGCGPIHHLYQLEANRQKH